MVEKSIVNGMVEILHSCGYSSGWSYYFDDMDIKNFLMFDKGLIDLHKRCAPVEEFYEYVKTKFEKHIAEEIVDVCETLWVFGDLMITQVPVGTLFRVEEYDGIEVIRVFDEKEYFVA